MEKIAWNWENPYAFGCKVLNIKLSFLDQININDAKSIENCWGQMEWLWLDWLPQVQGQSTHLQKKQRVWLIRENTQHPLEEKYQEYVHQFIYLYFG